MWIDKLNGDALPWLLEEDSANPGVRYFALRALAAIGAASAPRLGGEALAGIEDAQGAMHEHLQLAVGLAADRALLVQRQLARQHHPGDPELLRQELLSEVHARPYDGVLFHLRRDHVSCRERQYSISHLLRQSYYAFALGVFSSDPRLRQSAVLTHETTQAARLSAGL